MLTFTAVLDTLTVTGLYGSLNGNRHTHINTLNCRLSIHCMPYGLKLIKLLGDLAEADWKLMSF